jgi:hypothetical protein
VNGLPESLTWRRSTFPGRKVQPARRRVTLLTPGGLAGTCRDGQQALRCPMEGVHSMVFCGIDGCACHSEWDRRIRGMTSGFRRGVSSNNCSLDFSRRLLGKPQGRGFDMVGIFDTLEANALSREFRNLFTPNMLRTARRRLGAVLDETEIDDYIESSPERSWDCQRSCSQCRSWNDEGREV